MRKLKGFSKTSHTLLCVDEKKKIFGSATPPPPTWAAMRNFDLEVQSPFTIQGVDSLLKNENINAEISLTITDSLMWKPIAYGHESLINPAFKIISPYSELERKAVIIECRIPTADIFREMSWTLVLAFVLSLFLILLPYMANQYNCQTLSS